MKTFIQGVISEKSDHINNLITNFCIFDYKFSIFDHEIIRISITDENLITNFQIIDYQIIKRTEISHDSHQYLVYKIGFRNLIIFLGSLLLIYNFDYKFKILITNLACDGSRKILLILHPAFIRQYFSTLNYFIYRVCKAHKNISPCYVKYDERP